MGFTPTGKLDLQPFLTHSEYPSFKNVRNDALTGTINLSTTPFSTSGSTLKTYTIPVGSSLQIADVLFKGGYVLDTVFGSNAVPSLRPSDDMWYQAGDAFWQPANDTVVGATDILWFIGWYMSGTNLIIYTWSNFQYISTMTPTATSLEYLIVDYESI